MRNREESGLTGVEFYIVELIRLPQRTIIKPDPMPQIRDTQRPNRIKHPNHLHRLRITLHDRMRVPFPPLELRPGLGPREVGGEIPRVDVRLVELDEFRHGGRAEDPDFPDEAGAGAGGECAAGETEEVECVAGGVVVDDKVECFDDVVEEACAVAACRRGSVSGLRWEGRGTYLRQLLQSR